MMVLLDSAAFLSDPHLDGVAWSVLVHASQAWGLRILTTDVVIAEVVAGYQRHIRESQQELSKLSRILGPLGLKDILSAPLKALNESEESYSEHLRKRLASCGVKVIEVPPISHMEIVKRSVARRRPCDEKGDGYRDTLNWLTLLRLVKENPGDQVILVTNDNDFFSREGAALHQHLLEDLDAIGASGRVSSNRGLKELVLRLAGERSIEVGDDLRAFAHQLRNSTVLEYLSSSILPEAVASPLDVYMCGLPLETESASLLEFDNLRDLKLELTGQISGDLAVGEFELKADADIEFETPSSSEDLETLPESLEINEVLPHISKPLVFRGIITLDVHGKPRTAELSSIEALPDDPGRARWEEARKGVLRLSDWASVVAGNPALQRLTLSPDYLKALSRITFPPDHYVEALSRITFPPDYLKALSRITFPPDYLKALSRITFPPDYLKGAAPTTPGSEPTDQDEPPDDTETGESDGHPDQG